MRRYTIKINDTVHTLDVEQTTRDEFTVHLADGRLVDATLIEHRDLAQARIAPSVELGAPRILPDAAPGPATPPGPVPARPTAGAARPSRQAGGRGTVTAPMPGVVLSVAVAPGASVERGQTLLVLEAMKMKNEIKAETPGVVAQVLVAVGDQVRHGDLMLEFEG